MPENNTLQLGTGSIPVLLPAVRERTAARKTNVLVTLALYVTVVATAVVTYLPAVNNSFISDDFGMFTYIQAFRRAPLSILNVPSEFFRLTSYLYFFACTLLFGMNSGAFYWTGIGLHAAVSLLVYKLVLMTTGKRIAAWAAAVFFAAYERHHEAIMWISAANSTIVTLACVLFLILWLGSTNWARRLSLVVLIFALFSKETAVTLAPLALLISALRGSSWRSAFREAFPVLAITSGYIFLWLSYSGSNAFVTHHDYALSLHFFPVYVRAVVRMLSAAMPFAIAAFLMTGRSILVRLRQEQAALMFFSAVLALALIPVSFLTYQNSIPSRATYHPSVGLAAVVGILFYVWYSAMPSRKAGHWAIFFLMTVIGANIAYVWLKKDSQFIERASSTRQLILTLKELSPRLGNDKTLCIEEFPLDPWIGTETTRWFSAVPPSNVVFSNQCKVENHRVVLHWKTSDGLIYVRGGMDPRPQEDTIRPVVPLSNARPIAR
jgi:hypothetical protein